jgi:hypothetical protein
MVQIRCRVCKKTYQPSDCEEEPIWAANFSIAKGASDGFNYARSAGVLKRYRSVGTLIKSEITLQIDLPHNLAKAKSTQRLKSRRFGLHRSYYSPKLEFIDIKTDKSNCAKKESSVTRLVKTRNVELARNVTKCPHCYSRNAHNA